MGFTYPFTKLPIYPLCLALLCWGGFGGFWLGFWFCFGCCGGGWGLGFLLWWFRWRRRLTGGVVVENASAGAAGDDLLVGLELFPGLRADHDKAGHAFLPARLGNGRLALAHHAVIVSERAVTHLGT